MSEEQTRRRRAARKRTIRRRRAVAALAVATLAAGIGLSVALGDGTDSATNRFDSSDLRLRPLAGQRLVAGFPGEEPPAALRRMIRRGDLAGVILFSNNFDGAGGARRLIRGLQSIRRPRGLRDPLLVMVDQEGGLVKRLPGPPFASAAEMGARGEAFSRRQGRLTAESLAAAGFNVDLAPVLDVGRPGGAISDEERSFGFTAAAVSRSGVAFGEALQDNGVSATAKHFPGLGAAALNTDFGVVEIDLPAATIRNVDEAPFGLFVDSGGDLVMMSNAIYPAFSQRPAVFTRALVTGELRGRLGFEGVSITDALQAAAAQAFGGPERVGLAATRAGTDLLLFRQYQAAGRAGAALRKALRQRSLPRAEFVRSVQRVLDLREEIGAGG